MIALFLIHVILEYVSNFFTNLDILKFLWKGRTCQWKRVPQNDEINRKRGSKLLLMTIQVFALLNEGDSFLSRRFPNQTNQGQMNRENRRKIRWKM